MQVPPTPTSPKAKVSRSQELERLFREGGFQHLDRPPRPPRFSSTTLLFAIIFGFLAGIVGELVLNAFFLEEGGWLQRSLLSVNQATQQREISRTRRETVDLLNNLSSVNTTTLAIFPLESSQGIYAQESQIGTALLVSQDGWAVSAAPLFTEGQRYVAVTSDRRVFLINIFVRDPATDLIFFQIDGTRYPVVSFSVTDEELPPLLPATAVAGSSSNVILRVRDVSIEHNRFSPGDAIEQSDAPGRMLLLDAQLPDAFAGGALTDDRGNVLGLLRADENGQGTTVWPARVVSDALTSVLRSGNVSRPSLGVRYVDVALTPGIPESVRFQRSTGALLTGDSEAPAIVPSSPAEGAGLRNGDLVTHLDTQILSDQNGLSDLVQQYSPGEKVEVTVLRDGKEQKVTVTLGTLSFATD